MQLVTQVSPGVKMRVEFSGMTQHNVTTGWERSVRCVPSKSTTHTLASHGRWEWQDEHNGWNPYIPAVQRLLEACQLCGVGEWEMEAAGRRYKVEIGRGKAGLDGCGQQTNLDTGVQRRVRYSEGALVQTTKKAGKAYEEGRGYVGIYRLVDSPESLGIGKTRGQSTSCYNGSAQNIMVYLSAYKILCD